MIARFESWSEREVNVSLRRAGAAAGLGAVLFLASFGLLHVGVLSRHQIVDTGTYERYGDAVREGQVPYRDFAVEYPPAALPAFVLPALVSEDDYRPWFEALQALFGVAAIAFLALTLAVVRASSTRLFGGVAFAGLAPLALGPVVLTRYDLWPAALCVAALAALVAGRARIGVGVLALASAAKIYPLVLLPLALAYVARRRGGREAILGLFVAVGVLAAIVVPFAVVAPDGLADTLERQLGRPLQIESLGSSLLLAAHQLLETDVTVVSSHGSQNLAGPLPDAVAVMQTALQTIAVVFVWLLFVVRTRGSGPTPDDLLTACAAAVAAFVAFGKVLSPQFLIWLIPLVPLVAGRRGLAASAFAASALVLTQLWFPQRYWELVALGAGPTWLLLARDLALAAVAVVLASGGRLTRPARAAPRSG